MDRLFLAARIAEESWRERWETGKHHPALFPVCAASFVFFVMVLAIVV